MKIVVIQNKLQKIKLYCISGYFAKSVYVLQIRFLKHQDTYYHMSSKIYPHARKDHFKAFDVTRGLSILHSFQRPVSSLSCFRIASDTRLLGLQLRHNPICKMRYFRNKSRAAYIRIFEMNVAITDTVIRFYCRR